MNLSASSLLVLIALVLTVLSMVKPTWPLLAVAVLLVCVAILFGQSR